jgi:hypothetical protein
MGLRQMLLLLLLLLLPLLPLLLLLLRVAWRHRYGRRPEVLKQHERLQRVAKRDEVAAVGREAADVRVWRLGVQHLFFV